MFPNLNFKSGVALSVAGFGAGLQLNHVAQHFTDASNAEYYPDATVGIIPSYTVLDFSMKYGWKRYALEASINNLTDQIYFTRRATGYPGPGIIPAERRIALRYVRSADLVIIQTIPSLSCFNAMETIPTSSWLNRKASPLIIAGPVQRRKRRADYARCRNTGRARKGSTPSSGGLETANKAKFL